MSHAEIAQDIGDAMIFLSMGLAVACVVAYHIKTRGAWNSSEVGRHLMAFMGSMAGVLLVTAIRIVLVDVLHHDEPVWFYDIRVLTFASVPAVLAWRLIIILTADHDKEYEHDR